MHAELSFHISPTSGTPVHRQIIDQLERLIARGQVAPGSLAPPVNQLARQLAINPVAVSRAYRQLLEKGVLVLREDDGLEIASDGAVPADASSATTFLGSEPYVFVSYAHADRERVLEEIGHIRELGINVWYDDGISPGSSWDEEIAAALANCSLFLYFVTPASVASQHCRNEVMFCLSHGIRLLCVHLEETALPPGLELNLSGKQALSVGKLGTERYRDRLQASLRSMLPADVMAGPVPGAERTPDDIPALRRTVAVLPFANHTGDPSKDYLCNSLAEDLIVALAGIEGVSVVPAPDAFAVSEREALSVAELGERLRAAHVLTGSVQVSGDRIRARVSLSRAEDGSNRWTGRFDGGLEDLFAFQDELATRLVSELVKVLT